MDGGNEPGRRQAGWRAAALARVGWRAAALAGAVAGLALAPTAPQSLGAREPGLAAVAFAAGAALAVLRARGSRGGAGWLTAVGLAALAAGLGLGSIRTAAIDSGALRAEPGSRVSVRGFVEAVPRRSGTELRVRVATADGRLVVAGRQAARELQVGGEIRATGRLREPRDWERAYLARLGIARILEAGELRPTARRRGGLAAVADRVRERAEAALERGTPDAQAALLRGFVLGEDDRIDPITIEAFQRAGLAHLLAVSGQNVVLLALLAMPLLGLLGLGLRARLLWVLILIAIYVPVAGAGASIQRAGIMGAAGIVAALASRPASRWHALGLAALATLALNPRATGDVGWQLSFAAVAGIALWAAPLRDLLPGKRRQDIRGPLADGVAVTVAATLATAPLMAHHFDAVSVASLPANLLALPAVAPVMWLGMLAGAAGQLPWLPVEPLTTLAGLLAAYIEQVAAWLAAPGWAQVDVRLSSPFAVAAAYAALLAGAGLALRWGKRRRGLAPARARLGWRGVRVALAVAALTAAGLVALPAPEPRGSSGPGLRVTVLDVGQGDSILLDPEPGAAVLVDAGPPDAGVAERLAQLGVERLAAIVITHAQSDHAGGLDEVLARIPTARVVTASLRPSLRRRASVGGAGFAPVAAGGEVRSGRLRLGVLWPDPALLDAPASTDPNRLSVVATASWRDFDLLLTGDAEAELAPLHPGAVEVIKIAHHGSADEGLDALLARTVPRLAVISVGAGNPYGHPAPATLAALTERDIPVLRTDLDGEVVIEADASGWRVTG